ncbi:MAG: nitrate ABC transporter permease, partial [Eggerthellaceae bacterium]
MLFAIAASRMTAIRDLLAPLVAAVKAVPVASFVILVLIWVSSEHLSVIISFLMVFPIVYT